MATEGDIPDGDDFPNVHVHVVDLRNEESCHSLVERRAVHVDGGSHGDDEAAHAGVHVVVVLQAFQCHWHGGRTDNTHFSVTGMVAELTTRILASLAWWPN